jgi:hypothetical protein
MLFNKNAVSPLIRLFTHAYTNKTTHAYTNSHLQTQTHTHIHTPTNTNTNTNTHTHRHRGATYPSERSDHGARRRDAPLDGDPRGDTLTWTEFIGGICIF